MTPNEITTVLSQSLEEELDIPFRLQLMERVKIWRSRLIENTLQKHPEQRKFFKQSIYVKMTVGYAAECASPVSDKMSISIEKLPSLIRVGGTLFDYLGGVDGKSPFREIVGIGTQNYLSTGKFANWFPAYEYSNEKLFVDKQGIPFVRVDGIFDDPMAAMGFNCACTESIDCDMWNVQFPCSNSIMQLIIQSIVQIDYNRANPKPTEEIPVKV